jgi:hypothetical protein
MYCKYISSSCTTIIMENKHRTKFTAKPVCCSLQHEPNPVCFGCKSRLRLSGLCAVGLAQGVVDCFCEKCPRCGCFYEDYYLDDNFEEHTRDCHCTK